MDNDNGFGYWQLCPKCGGEGEVYREDYGIKTEILIGWFTCPVCHGAKVLARPLLIQCENFQRSVATADAQGSDDCNKTLPSPPKISDNDD